MTVNDFISLCRTFSLGQIIVISAPDDADVQCLLQRISLGLAQSPPVPCLFYNARSTQFWPQPEICGLERDLNNLIKPVIAFGSGEGYCTTYQLSVDRAGGTYWSSIPTPGPQEEWLAVSFPERYLVSKVQMLPRKAYSDAFPTDFYIERTLNYADWVEIIHVTNFDPTGDAWFEYELPSPELAWAIRMRGTSRILNGEYVIQLAELAAFSPSAVPGLTEGMPWEWVRLVANNSLIPSAKFLVFVSNLFDPEDRINNPFVVGQRDIDVIMDLEDRTKVQNIPNSNSRALSSARELFVFTSQIYWFEPSTDTVTLVKTQTPLR